MAGKIANRRKEVRDLRYQRAEELAAAEEAFHEAQAVAYVFAKHNGETDRGADLVAKGESALHRYHRDLARGQLKAVDEELEALEKGRVMLKGEADWSQRIDPAA